MPSYLVQAGAHLYRMTRAGVATQVDLPTLPVPITLTGPETPLRMAVFPSAGNAHSPIVICVNGCTHDFYIDTFGVARSLQLQPPTYSPTAAAGVGTGLSGIYMVAATFKIKDANGATISESGLSPASAPTASLANKTIAITNLPVSADGSVNARGLYRTLSGGNTFYPWFDVDDNLSLSVDRGIADSLLSLLPTDASRNGTPPDLSLVVVWLDRLWGVPRFLPDHLRWTDDRNFYAWSADNEALIPPTNSDEFGITALIPRRGGLGVTRRNYLYTMIGFSNDSFQRVAISETLGCVSQESVVVVENTAYMLGTKGVNEWSDSGISSISDAQVSAWFTTDTYFNRAMFPKAQGRYNPETDAYELLLASAGSEVLDRWVSFHRGTRAWYGPHLTTKTTFACAGTGTTLTGVLTNENNQAITVFGGSDGHIYQRDSSSITDAGAEVPFSVHIAPLSANLPDQSKVFGRFTIHTRMEAQGILAIVPTVGVLEETDTYPILHDLTVGREVMDRIGIGNYCSLTLSHSSATEGVRIYGIEIPYTLVGRR